MNDQLHDILEDLHAAESKCQLFEKQYGLLSEYFFDAFTNGEIDDDGNLDFVEWAGYYKSKLDRLRRYRATLLKESPAMKRLQKIATYEAVA